MFYLMCGIILTGLKNNCSILDTMSTSSDDFSESGSYYLLGPINSGSKILVVTSKNKIPFFLTLVSGPNNSMELIFDPRGDMLKALELTINTQSPGIRLSFPNVQGIINYITTTKTGTMNVASTTEKPDHLIQITTEAATWNAPTEFLAGIHYHFNNQVNKKVSWKAFIPDLDSIDKQTGLPTQILMDNGNPQLQFFEEDIRVLPCVWYQSSNCFKTPDVGAVVTLENDWVTGAREVPDGFVQLEECKEGRRYSYCAPKQQCGNECKGPCLGTGGTGSICKFNTGKDAFDCAPPSKKDDKKPIIIAAIVVVAIILFVLFFLFIIHLSSSIIT